MNVKIIICLALVFICLNEAVAQKGKKGKGMMPCGAKDNVEECTCEDGVTYPAEEVKESCGKANDNKLKRCLFTFCQLFVYIFCLLLPSFVYILSAVFVLMERPGLAQKSLVVARKM